MKATIDVPDGIYRRVKARSALEGRSVRDVTVVLIERWLAEAPALDSEGDLDRPAAADGWLRQWESIGDRIAKSAMEQRTTRTILTADRAR